MKITDIKTAVIVGYGDWILLRVDTDEDISGLGECFPALARAARPTIETIRVAARLLTGEDPRDVNRLWTNLYEYFLGRPGSMAGLVTTVISGIEIALLDILGKSLGAPLYQLLGGRYRDRIRVYADCGQGKGLAPSSYARKAKEAVAKGFTALKFDVDGFSPVFTSQDWHPQADDSQDRETAVQLRDPYARAISATELQAIVERVRAVREAVGNGVDIAFDTGGYNIESAIRLARAVEPYNLMWLEDPLPREDAEQLARLKQACSTPILTGECFYTRFGFKHLLEEGAVDLISPDIQKMGGVLEARRVADMASLKYIPIAPHCVCTPVGTAASVHLCAVVPNFTILEYHSIHLPYWQDLIASPKRFLNGGFIDVPDGPGLGVELDYEVAKRYARDGEGFFE
jgi:L-alanine-DL-glutamate epimerase-like enolase superfamily enzyme